MMYTLKQSCVVISILALIHISYVCSHKTSDLDTQDERNPLAAINGDAGTYHADSYRKRIHKRHNSRLAFVAEKEDVGETTNGSLEAKHHPISKKKSTGYNKKYFDDEPIDPRANIDKTKGCEEGLIDCSHEEPIEVFTPEKLSRKRRHRRSEQTPGDLATAESASPCIGNSWPCGSGYDPSAFIRHYNQLWQNLPKPELSPYYLPVPRPDQELGKAPLQPYLLYPVPHVLWNPGFPKDNRPDFYGPVTSTPNEIKGSNKNTGMNVGTRIGADDDRVSWGVVEPQRRWNAPTRRPNAVTRRPSPPLIHNSIEEPTTQRPRFEQTTTQRPRLEQTTTRRPAVGGSLSRPGSNTASDKSLNPVTVDQVPRPCMWAIISCCDARSDRVELACFERLGCPGPFWDRNPCSQEIALIALNAATEDDDPF